MDRQQQSSPLAGLIFGGIFGWFSPWILEAALGPFLNSATAFWKHPIYPWIGMVIGALIGLFMYSRKPE